MYFVIFMMIPLISARKTDKIKRNLEQNDYDEYPYYDNNYLLDMIVYDDYNYYEYHNKAPYNLCEGEIGHPWFKVGSYEIIIQMGSALFSGTDDKVEIRLYGPNSEISEWLALTEPLLIDGIDGFERLSQDTV